MAFTPSHVPAPLAWAMMTLLMGGCISVKVEPLVLQRYPARPANTQIEVLQAEPAQPHVAFARLIATSEYADDDALRAKILTQARRLGADAIVVERSEVLKHMRQGSMYQSTLAPGLQNPLFGGLGSGWPFFFDPWTFSQGPTDRTDYLNFLSAVAIRYIRARPLRDS